MRRGLRWAVGAALGLALLTGAGFFAAKTALEAGHFTPRIDAALEGVVGRPVTLGAITLRLGLPPRLSVADAMIANPPEASRPDFARIGRLDLTVALRPLLSGEVVIVEAILADADLRFEHDAAGRANWQLGTAVEGGGRFRMEGLRVENSRLEILDNPLGPLAIRTAELRPGTGGALALDAQVMLREEALTLTAQIGAGVAGIQPLQARLAGAGFHLTAEGTLARETTAPGWSLALAAEVASTTRLAGLLQAPGEWPGTGPITGRATLGPGLALTGLGIATGPLTLGGATLRHLRLAAADPDQGTTLEAAGEHAGLPFALTARLPSPRRMLAEPSFPADARITSGGAALNVTTRLGRNGISGPTDFQLTAPDLATLSPAAGFALPGLRAFDGRVRIADPQARPLRLDRMRIQAAQLEATGDIQLGLAPRVSLRGGLQFIRLDLDALTPPGPPAAADGRVIPDFALPVEALPGFDAALDITAATLTAGGLTWRALRTRAVLTGGRLVLDPLSIEPPGGGFAGTLSLDAAATPPRLAVALRSRGRGFNVAPLRRALGLGVWLDGPAEIALDLNGQGRSLRAVAATLGGEFGLAMIEGRMPRAGMVQVGPNLTRLLMPGGPPDEGIAIRCLALRMTAENGLAQSQALLVEGPPGRLEGNLALNLRDETLVARLLPDIRMLGFNMRAPVDIGGTLAAPSFGVEPGQALARVMADTVTNRLWRSSTVEWLRGPGGGDCAAQLRLARLGRAGPVPEPAPSVIPIVPRELQGPVQDVLRGLGGILGGGRR